MIFRPLCFCERHGWAPTVFVCRHVKSGSARKPVRMEETKLVAECDDWICTVCSTKANVEVMPLCMNCSLVALEKCGLVRHELELMPLA